MKYEDLRAFVAEYINSAATTALREKRKRITFGDIYLSPRRLVMQESKEEHARKLPD